MNQIVLTSFDRPPVIETVLGVQFDPLTQFTNGHLGAFWRTLGADWPKTSDAPAVEPTFEEFGERESWFPEGLRLRLIKDPSARLWIKNAAEDRLIQVQNGRFHYNWLKKEGSDYPRYSVIRPEFQVLLVKLEQFVQSEGLGPPRFNQWEVTYVNHLPKGTVWNSPEEWASLFRALPGIALESDSMRRLEGMMGTWRFEISPQRGRLHVELKHGRQSARGPEVLVLTLTARGKPSEPCARSVAEGLDLGRFAVVSAFADLTSESAHQYWGRRS